MISTYKKITESVRNEGKRLGLDVGIYSGAMQEAVEYAKNKIREGKIDVIMSRGGTAELLKESLDFPVVQILPSNMTLLVKKLISILVSLHMIIRTHLIRFLKYQRY